MKRTILCLAFLLAASTFGGCLASFNTLYPPAVGVSQTILPEYESYVQADTKLTESDKTIRLNNSKSFRNLVNEYGK